MWMCGSVITRLSDTMCSCPLQVPIAFADYELGANVQVGGPDFREQEDNPCGRAYQHFCENLPSWCVYQTAQQRACELELWGERVS
mmetsp:Transcript_61037/g.167413  ORF Transcript_61037/g.167413 Transcript_61037/m.167413 type:complete len:86 (+) Transcript_61037:754-1011(+)